jgi:hypothetical protein
MINLLRKEMKLSASMLSYLFIAFGLMFFLPGYPILCGVFFVALGIFYSFQNARETNDIIYSILLPIAKKDVVKAKFLFSCFIELCSFALMVAVTIMRMTILSESSVYRSNALMNANPFALGMALTIFGLYNSIFIGGFFKTAYNFGKPFLMYIMAAFLTIGIGETLHHFPRLEILNAFGFENIILQTGLFGVGALCYVLMTFLSYRNACKHFETIDL